MATGPQRRSKVLPPDFSELMDNLSKHTDSFIELFENSRDEMGAIVEKLRGIAAEARKMHKKTDTLRMGGLILGGAIIGAAIIAAPLTGGLSLATGAAVASAVGGTVGGTVAGAVVVGANLRKIDVENKSVQQVKELGEAFRKIVEPMKNELEEIKETCEKLEQKSTEVQAKISLSDVEEFQRLLSQVSVLGRRVVEVLDVAIGVINTIGRMLILFAKVITPIATPEDDRKFRDSIIRSADQAINVIVGFDKMKEELRSITGK